MRRLLLFVLAAVFMLGSGCIYNQQEIARQNAEYYANKRAKSRQVAEAGLNSVARLPKLNKKWEGSLEGKIKSLLKDPDSAKFRYAEDPKYCSLSNLYDLFSNDYTVTSSSPLLGYTALVHVNAKNSYGGYTGENSYIGMFGDNGELIAFFPFPYDNNLEEVGEHLQTSFSEALVCK